MTGGKFLHFPTAVLAFAANDAKIGVVGPTVLGMNARGRAALLALPAGTGSWSVATGCGVMRALTQAAISDPVMSGKSSGGGGLSPLPAASSASIVRRDSTSMVSDRSLQYVDHARPISVERACSLAVWRLP